jgi:hypothetical protein
MKPISFSARAARGMRKTRASVFMADGKIAGGRITGEERFSCVGRAFFVMH